MARAMGKATPLNIVQDFLCVAIQEILTGKDKPKALKRDSIYNIDMLI